MTADPRSTGLWLPGHDPGRAHPASRRSRRQVTPVGHWSGPATCRCPPRHERRRLRSLVWTALARRRSQDRRRGGHVVAPRVSWCRGARPRAVATPCIPLPRAGDGAQLAAKHDTGGTDVLDVDVSPSLRARDAEHAARATQPIVGAAVAVVIVSTIVDPANHGWVAQVGSWTVVTVLVGLFLLCRLTDPDRLDRTGVLVAVPTLGALLVIGLNLLTQDTSAAAQVFLALPTLWAATQLRAGAAAVVTGTAVTGNSVLVFLLEAAPRALADTAFVATALVLLTWLQVRSGDRQSVLVDRLETLAAVDPLTGLVTRRVLDDALSSALSSAASVRGTALILIDVDCFKSINDGHGHPAGDDALRHLASVLRSTTRHGDSVISRMGGDELAVLLPGCSSEVAARRAHELLDAVRAAPLELTGGVLLALTVSIGVAHCPADAQGIRELYAAADSALYRAKRGGRNRVALAG